MFKNVASQKIPVFVYDAATGAPKTGDAANLTAYLSKDSGTVTALTDTSAAEMDATNAKGWYLFDVSQTETNADALLFTGKSSTTGIYVVGQLIYTDPPNYTSLTISSGLVGSNLTQINSDTTSAASLAKTTRAIGRGTCTTGGTTTSVVTGAFIPVGAAANQFVGRVITFDADTTTTALRGQATDITASSNAANPTFTVTALTSAPASGDTFSVT